MSKPRIGLDLDGVVYEWDKTARYMLREVYMANDEYFNLGEPTRLTNYAKELLTYESRSWDYIRDSVPRAAWNWLWSEGVRLGLFRYGHVVKGAVNGVRELARFADVEVITHRPANAIEDTLAWLSFMRLPFKGVHLLTHQEPKHEVRPTFDVYIDDKPENCDLLNTVGDVVMFGRAWNTPGHPYMRTEGWPETVAQVRRLLDADRLREGAG